MEITIDDIKNLKLSPTLICFLKAIHLKDEEYLEELHKVSNVFDMAKYLQSRMILKITGNNLLSSSFEIRDLKIIDMLNNIESKSKKSIIEAERIFNYFKSILEKHNNKKSRIDFKTYKDFLKGRVNQGVTFDNAKEIIDLKFKQWYNTSYQNHLNFQTLLGSKHYGQYLQQLEIVDNTSSEDLNTVKA